MREVAVIKEIFGKDGRYARVLIKRTSACGENCGNCSGNCAVTTQTVVANNLVRAEKDDTIIIEMHDSTVLFGAFLMYIVPIIIMFTGYGVGEVLFKNETYSICAGAIFFVCSFLVLKKVDKILMKTGKYRAYITKILKNEK